MHSLLVALAFVTCFSPALGARVRQPTGARDILGSITQGWGAGIGETLGKTFGALYANPSLGDSHLTQVLASCAEHVYDPSNHNHGVLKYVNVIDYHLEPRSSHCKPGELQWATYKLKTNGRIIFAIRGTASINTVLQDVSWFFGSSQIRDTIAYASKLAKDKGADYVTGHSLGGCLAETVCSWTGIPGASFNAPGPWSAGFRESRRLTGTEHDGVRFEVHLSNLDPVSHLGARAQTADSSHIARSQWHETFTRVTRNPHSMTLMCEAIGRQWEGWQDGKDHDGSSQTVQRADGKELQAPYYVIYRSSWDRYCYVEKSFNNLGEAYKFYSQMGGRNAWAICDKNAAIIKSDGWSVPTKEECRDLIR